MAFEKRTTVSALSNELERPEEDVIELLESLEAKGVIQRAGDEGRKLGERPN